MLTRILALLALLVVGLPAYAQTVSVSSTVNWTPPTTDSNGVPLTTPGDPNIITGYNIYESTSPLTATPSAPTTTAAVGATSAVVSTPSAAPGSTLYFYVTACDSTGCSALSTAASKVVTVPGAAPSSPSNVTVTLTVTVSVATATK